MKLVRKFGVGAAVLASTALWWAPSTRAVAAAHLVEDPAGDANGLGTGFEFGPASSAVLPNDASVDVVTGDITVAEGIASFRVQLAQLDAAPAEHFDGRKFVWSVTTARGTIWLESTQTTSEPIFEVWYEDTNNDDPNDDGAVTDRLAATGIIDTTAATVTLTISLADLDALVQSGSDGVDDHIATGSRLYDPTITAGEAVMIDPRAISPETDPAYLAGPGDYAATRGAFTLE